MPFHARHVATESVLKSGVLKFSFQPIFLSSRHEWISLYFAPSISKLSVFLSLCRVQAVRVLSLSSPVVSPPVSSPAALPVFLSVALLLHSLLIHWSSPGLRGRHLLAILCPSLPARACFPASTLACDSLHVTTLNSRRTADDGQHPR